MPLFTRKNLLTRLYKISFVSALLISLPVFMLAGWMVTNSYIEYKRFVDIACGGVDCPSFNADIMHLYLRENLKRMYLRATAPEMPTDDELPTIEMSIAKESLAALNADLPKSGKVKYYRAYIKYGGKSYAVKARYMGDNHWHWLYPQKSWRIKTKKKKLIEGARKFNIKNPRSIVTWNECLAQELARDVGLIAPRVFPVKLVVNNVYKGVHLFSDVINETILRRSNLMPGSVYSGDGAPPDPRTGVSLLWRDQKWWKKSASRNSERKQYRGDITALIGAVNSPRLRDFYNFAKKHVDNEAYASFLSLDNALACAHHDFNHNHKLYFDPIRGKFVPISWDIDDWHLDTSYFDVAGNPFQYKWKLIPTFDLLRKKRLYKLITSGALSMNSILQKMKGYNERTRIALAADTFRDAKSWGSSHIIKFPKYMGTIFTMTAYDNRVKWYKTNFKKRIAMLKSYLTKSRMACNLTPGRKKDHCKVLRIVAYGNVGRLLTSVRLFGFGKAVTIYKDINHNYLIDSQDVIIGEGSTFRREIDIPVHEQVLPGYRKTWRDSNKKDPYLSGNYSLEAAPLEYDFLIRVKEGEIRSVKIVSQNIITEEPLDTEYGDIPKDVAKKTISLHPWDLPAESKKTSVVLGPGRIKFVKSVIYPENISLKILPGTTIFLCKDVSIFCYGNVTARGTNKKPIFFRPLAPDRPWGVFALQGKGASGSTFEYCSWKNGSDANKDMIYYSGMVSVHDADNVVFKNCSVGHNFRGDDAMHLAYCKGFVVQGCGFVGARSDALDVDISEGKVISSRFERCGNDGLDLMTSNMSIKHCVFESTGDKGISVGERTNLAVDGCVFVRCHIGLEVKDRSCVNYGENLIEDSGIAISLYKKNWRYEGGGRFKGDIIFAINCEQNLKMDKHSTANFQSIETSDPGLPVWQETIEEAGSFAPMSNKD